jgi:predicted dinucleotide-binding enzyme
LQPTKLRLSPRRVVDGRDARDDGGVKITFIGYGNVGAALAANLARVGHEVVLAQGREESESLKKALGRAPTLTAAPTAEAIARAEVVFLATPYGANEALLTEWGKALAGKVLVDCTNPVGPGLSHGLGSARSGSQAVQSLAPGAKVVKAFTIYGFENFENTEYPGYGVKPAMFLCGDDEPSKEVVSRLASELGWEPLDVGGLEQALHLEHMTLLWVRMVRAKKHSPNMVWAVLRR